MRQAGDGLDGRAPPLVTACTDAAGGGAVHRARVVGEGTLLAGERRAGGLGTDLQRGDPLGGAAGLLAGPGRARARSAASPVLLVLGSGVKALPTNEPSAFWVAASQATALVIAASTAAVRGDVGRQLVDDERRGVGVGGVGALDARLLGRCRVGGEEDPEVARRALLLQQEVGGGGGLGGAGDATGRARRAPGRRCWRSRRRRSSVGETTGARTAGGHPRLELRDEVEPAVGPAGRRRRPGRRRATWRATPE